MNWLDYVILAMSCIAELYICQNFFAAFFPKRKSLDNNVISVTVFVLFVVFEFAVNLIGSATLNLLLTPVIFILYMALIYETRTVQLIMYIVLVISVILGSEFLFTVIAETTNKDSGLNLSSMPWQTFTIKLMSFMILLIIKQLSDRTKDKLTNKIFWMYLFIPVASLGMMFSTYFISKEVIDELSVKIALSVSFAFMLSANIIVFTAFNQYAKELYLSMQQKWIISKERMNRQHYEKIADMNENRQTLIHDLKHYLSGLRAFLKEQGTSEVLEFLGELNSKLDSNELRVYSDIPFLDAILSEKENYANDSGVSLTIQVEPGCVFDSVHQMDYVVMLGNLIDNAIQAAEKSKIEPYVNINIFMENYGMFLITKISNNYNNDNLIMNGGEFLSSKKDEGIHGIGIKSVKKMAIHHGGMFNVDIKKNTFTAILILPSVNL